MKILIPIFVSISLFAVCPNKSPNDISPKVIGTTQEICFQQFGVLYSSKYKIPLASFEKLTNTSVSKSTSITRKNTFHAEPKVIDTDMPLPQDYVHSGYDKGHMTACDDAPTIEAQYETFSMVNMIPQLHHNNAGVWKQYEQKVRLTALKQDTYVVSGPIIYGNEDKLKNKITIPKYLYKAIHNKSETSVYIFANSDNNDTVVKYNLKDFVKKYKINPFPGL